MTSIWSRAWTCARASPEWRSSAPRPSRRAKIAHRHKRPGRADQPAPPIVRPAPQPPALSARAASTSSASFNGRVGIAVKSVDDGWTTAGTANELYPQQSVSKLWVAITALDAVDKGRVRLTDQVSLGRSDLTLFHQPIAREDPRRRLHDDARRSDVQGDHQERQHRQRQADALGRRARGGARDDPATSGSARSASTTASARCRAGSPA